MILSGLCSVFVRAFTLFPFRSFMLLPVCHCFLPVSSPCASLFPPCAFLCLFVYAMCPLVVVPVSTPHLFPITRFVSLINKPGDDWEQVRGEDTDNKRAHGINKHGGNKEAQGLD